MSRIYFHYNSKANKAILGDLVFPISVRKGNISVVN